MAANALSLPEDLQGFAYILTINFPWGSLRDLLIRGEADGLTGTLRVCAPGAQVMVRLNESALAEAGNSIQAGMERAVEGLTDAGISIDTCEEMDRELLKVFPSTWARKMAFGRMPRGVAIGGHMLKSSR